MTRADYPRSSGQKIGGVQMPPYVRHRVKDITRIHGHMVRLVWNASGKTHCQFAIPNIIMFYNFSCLEVKFEAAVL